MAVTAGVLLEIILMIFLRRIEINQRPYLNKEIFASAALYLGNALHCLSCVFVRVVNACLILAAHIVPLSVFNRRINNIEVRKQQCVEADLFGVIFDSYRLSKARTARAHLFVVGIGLAGAVGIAAARVDNSGDRLHKLFNAPKATARKEDNIFGFF